VKTAPGDTGAALTRTDRTYVGRFSAMAGPCEVIVDTDDRVDAAAAVAIAEREALRIERKFSRYRDDNIVHRINHSDGRAIAVDEETARLFDYATTCHAISGGLFDITSGVLRRAWMFDGGGRVPEPATIAQALALVGWHRVCWEGRALTLLPGMEIDLGGLGKEYAVDRTAALIAAETRAPVLVNFGGDLYAGGPRRGGRPWSVGVDDPARTGVAIVERVDLLRGGLATSGDARRFVSQQGRRLGHILDPRTGWPVEGAPRSVTVVGPTCLEAGTLSTIAALMGPGAREFLEEQGVTFWIT
jgi:thiamine biosynthesis lipoprotein